MGRDSFTYSHGDSGTEPSSLDFAANDKPNPQHFDWFWDSVVTKINSHADEFGVLDSDNDGVVDAADEVETGGSTAVVRDTTNTQDIAQFKEGGNVDVPNGKLKEKANRVATRTWATGSNINHSDLADAPSGAHHSKTSSASELTDVSADSVSGAHHAKYTDSEATTAVGGSTPWANSDLSNSSVTVAGNAVSLGGSTSVSHGDLSDAPSSAHHSRYSDSEAVSAVESAGLDMGGSDISLGDGNIDGINDIRFQDGNGDNIALYMATGSKLSIVPKSSNGPIKFETGEFYENGNRVATRNWALAGANYNPEADTHNKYTDSEARSAVDGSGINKLVLNNEEDPGGDGGLIQDYSVGFIAEWGGNGPAVLWDSYNVSAGTDINISGGTGSEGQPTINHANTSGQGNVNTGGSTVIDDIHIDGRGHVTNMNTQNRSLDDWNSANGDVYLGDNDLQEVNRIGDSGYNNYWHFRSNSSWIEATDGSGSRERVVTADVYIDDQSDSNGNNWIRRHLSDSDAHHSKTQTSDVTSSNWGDYDIQKNGTDGTDVINFKT